MAGLGRVVDAAPVEHPGSSPPRQLHPAARSLLLPRTATWTCPQVA
jgi:hypothetical protein